MSSKPALVISSMILFLLSAPGCHDLECANDEDCPFDWACVGSSLCPEDVVCVWEGEPGLCQPTREAHLCFHSGGEWDESSCGHYTCGEFPECDAVIPGCDCGPAANFVEGEGCVEDSACPPLPCSEDSQCPDDLSCVFTGPDDRMTDWTAPFALPVAEPVLEDGICRSLPLRM
jgi:hypothetical protein